MYIHKHINTNGNGAGLYKNEVQVDPPKLITADSHHWDEPADGPHGVAGELQGVDGLDQGQAGWQVAEVVVGDVQPLQLAQVDGWPGDEGRPGGVLRKVRPLGWGHTHARWHRTHSTFGNRVGAVAHSRERSGH